MKTVHNLGVTLSSPLSLPQTRWSTAAVMAAVVTRSQCLTELRNNLNKQTNRVYVILLLQS